MELFLCVIDKGSLNPKEFSGGMPTTYPMLFMTVFTQKYLHFKRSAFLATDAERILRGYKTHDEV